MTIAHLPAWPSSQPGSSQLGFQLQAVLAIQSKWQTIDLKGSGNYFSPLPQHLSACLSLPICHSGHYPIRNISFKAAVRLASFDNSLRLHDIRLQKNPKLSKTRRGWQFFYLLLPHIRLLQQFASFYSLQIIFRTLYVYEPPMFSTGCPESFTPLHWVDFLAFW